MDDPLNLNKFESIFASPKKEEPAYGDDAENIDIIKNDIADFVNELGIAEKRYTVTIKRQNGSSYAVLPIFNFANGKFPSAEEIGKQYGPGQYYIMFSFQQKDPTTDIKKAILKNYKIELGPEWASIAHDHYISQTQKTKQDMQVLKDRREIEDTILGTGTPEVKPVTGEIAGLIQSMEVMDRLGVPRGNNNNNNNNNDALITYMMKSAENQAATAERNNNNNMTMMVHMMNNSTKMMLGILSNQNNNNGGNKIMEDMTKMVLGAIDLKEALTPEKEGIVDKIFGVLASVAPSLAVLANKPRRERIEDPLYKMATETEEFEQVKNDPMMLNELINRWDEKFSPDDTDDILSSVGWARPKTHVKNGPTGVADPIENAFEEADITDPIITPAPEKPKGTDTTKN